MIRIEPQIFKNDTKKAQSYEFIQRVKNLLQVLL